MKYVLLLLSMVTMLGASEPKDTEPKPVLPSSMQLTHPLEIPIRQEPAPEMEDKAEPRRKTFAELMITHSFKCWIL